MLANYTGSIDEAPSTLRGARAADRGHAARWPRVKLRVPPGQGLSDALRGDSDLLRQPVVAQAAPKDVRAAITEIKHFRKSLRTGRIDLRALIAEGRHRRRWLRTQAFTAAWFLPNQANAYTEAVLARPANEPARLPCSGPSSSPTSSPCWSGAKSTDGAFDADGSFTVLPPVPRKLLEQGFRKEVLAMLLRDGLVTEALAKKMLGWRQSGFSADNSVRVRARDSAAPRRLVQDMLRAPFALEEMAYDADSGIAIYRSHMHKTLAARRATAFPLRTTLAQLTIALDATGDLTGRHS
jgi:hypothetical protein